MNTITKVNNPVKESFSKIFSEAKPDNKFSVYVIMVLIGIVFIGLSGYLYFQMADKKASFISIVLSYGISLMITYLLTKKDLQEEYENIIDHIKSKYEKKVNTLRKDHDTTTLERTIREGTRTLIKNAVDYFKIENIKNEIPSSAAIQNLQLDKYGQIIELLADFSLILPDYHENQAIVQEEITHQIDIYLIDEKDFAQFLQRIMEKYIITVNKKIQEKGNEAVVELKTCPKCNGKVHRRANACKYCAHEFKKAVIKTFPTPAPVTEAAKPRTKTKPLDGSKKGTPEMLKLKEGEKLYRTGNYDGALKTLNGAIKLNSKFSLAYYNRGIVHEKLGNQSQALNDITAAAQLGHKKAQKFLHCYMDAEKFPFAPANGS